MEDEKKELINGVGIATTKAIEFVEKIIANPIIEGTGILTDKIKYYRFQRQVETVLKAIEFLKKKNIKTPKKIPVKDLTTLLDYASYEDDEEMQDSWSTLLANALNPNNTFNTCFLFSKLLNQISIDEISILKHLYRRSFIVNASDRPFIKIGNIIDFNNSSFSERLLLIDNLLRLRLVEEKLPEIIEYENKVNLFKLENDYYELVNKKSEEIRLTHLGVELINKITNF